MKLYIGNATKQRFEFQYWVPDKAQSAPHRQMVEIGAQILIAGDLNVAQIEGIVAQHRDYGLIEVSEIDNTRAFTGICYSVDKPIPAAKLARLIVINNPALVERGRETRKRGAIAEHSRLEQAAQEAGLPVPDAYEMIIEEEKTTTRDQSDGMLSETLTVTRDEEGEAPKPRRRVRA